MIASSAQHHLMASRIHDQTQETKKLRPLLKIRFKRCLYPVKLDKYHVLNAYFFQLLHQ